MKTLIVEDDRDTLDYLTKGFRDAGYAVDSAVSGADGLRLAMSSRYRLVILDRMLPGMDGLSVLSALRSAKNSTPVIILSALAHVDERIKGLKAGGDDYLTKPFSLQELLLRSELLVRKNRESSANSTTLAVDDLTMDLVDRRVSRAGREIRLRPKEFLLLKYLLEHQGQVVSRSMLFEAVWNYRFDPQTNVIDVHMAKLRRKLEENSGRQLIDTVRGAGYVVNSL